VNLDAAIQEAKIGPLPILPDPARFRAPEAVLPSSAALQNAAKLLSEAKNPVILMGRASRSLKGWQERIELAEKLQAQVLTDLKMSAVFPTDHPLHPVAPGVFFSPAACQLLRSADVVLALDWYDLAGALKQAWGAEAIGSKVIQVSPDQLSHRGWSMDYQGLPPVDVYMLCETDPVVPLLIQHVLARAKVQPLSRQTLPEADPEVVSIRALADAVNFATEGLDVCFSGVPLGWNGQYRHFNHPMEYIGLNGGGGIGAGPGISIGSALALKGTGRIPIGILGDGDFMMGVSAIWTAAHYHIPCLIIVANNRSYFNDEVHQERVANERLRPVENKWVGQRIDDPDIDLAMIARAQGALGLGPVKDAKELNAVIQEGIQGVKAGKVCVIDVRVLPGYDTNMSGSQASQKR